MISKISPRKFEKEPRVGHPQRIETDELQALLDTNAEQIEKELAEQLSVSNKSFPYVYTRMVKV